MSTITIYMYFYFKFLEKFTYNAKAMTKKPLVQGQRDKKNRLVFLAITSMQVQSHRKKILKFFR